MDQRRHLQRLITENGAEYHSQLVREVTHLVANKPQGEKYKFAQAWKLKIVSVEWLLESAERGMILEEDLYNPAQPQEERGKNAWVRTAPTTTTARGKRSRQDEGAMDAADDIKAGRKKLRRTASIKLQDQNSTLWSDIVGSDHGPITTSRASYDSAPLRIGEEQAVSRQDVGSQHGDDLNPRKDESVRIRETFLDDDSLVPEARGLFFDRSFYLHGFDEKKVNQPILSETGA